VRRSRGRTVDYNGAPTGYTADPQEAITYVEAHDNETLYDALAFKLPQSTSMADRVRMQALSYSTVLLGQGRAVRACRRRDAAVEVARSQQLRLG
jgi:pullulanase/glycogen debranching enzyme